MSSARKNHLGPFLTAKSRRTLDQPKPESDTPYRTVGLREICDFKGRAFWRLRGATQWEPYELDVSGAVCREENELFPSIVLQLQANGQHHWSLFLAAEGQKGEVFQVKGDVELMRYLPFDEVDLTASNSYVTSYVLSTIPKDKVALIREVARQEPPPSAPNRREVRENCQGWTIRVIKQLISRGVVPSHKLAMAERLQEPI